MKNLAFLLLGAFAAVGLFCDTARAHTEFRTVVQTRYDFKTVSCYTCHVPREEKSVRNDVGQTFAKLLEGQDLTAKLAAVEELDSEDPVRVKAAEEASAIFLKALEELEKTEHPDGGTWADAFKAGKIEGTKLKE